MKNQTVCLTGHRPKGLPWGYDEEKDICKKFKKHLRLIFRKIIKKGFTNFYTGMAEGFDMIATEILLEFKKIYKDIKIIAVIPCLGQEKNWKQSQIDRYYEILNQCDEKIILSKTYTKTCMNDRNKFMVDHSSVVIACYNGQPSGTENTIRFAKENGCKIRLINPTIYK